MKYKFKINRVQVKIFNKIKILIKHKIKMFIIIQ